MSRVRFVAARGKPAHLLARNPVFRAFGGAPMTPGQQTDLALAARIAFDSVRKGQCTEADRDTLACMVNVAMVLAERHCSQAELDAALAAQEAMLRADGRAQQGMRWMFDGTGLAAFTRILDVHEQQVALLGRAEVTAAVLEVGERRARGQVHRVVLARPEAA